jgi:hypothetical protein
MREINLPGFHFPRGESFLNQGDELASGGMDAFEIGVERASVKLGGRFDEHFAIADNLVKRSAEGVPQLRQRDGVVGVNGLN